MHVHSVGIEVNNFGYLKNGRTYAGQLADDSQVVELSEPFRGFSKWHRYSNKQIENLRKLILHIANRDNIDVRQGLPAAIKKHGANKGFDFNEDAFIEGCEKAIKRVRENKINLEGLKLQEDFSYSKMFDKVLGFSSAE